MICLLSWLRARMQTETDVTALIERFHSCCVLFAIVPGRRLPDSRVALRAAVSGHSHFGIAVRRGFVWAAVFTCLSANCLCQAKTPTDDQRQMAIALEQQGQTADAEAVWKAVLKTHPSDAE